MNKQMGEVLYINMEYMIIYTTKGAHISQSRKEFDSILIQTKRDIANRPNVLDRFEHWEILEGNIGMIDKILIVRSRNGNEKALVAQYIRRLKCTN